MEKWKSLGDGFKISNLGNVICPNGKKAVLTGRAYLRYTEGGKKIYEPLHMIVAKLFVPNPNKFKIAVYKDGDKSNKKASNLEWSKNYSKRGMPTPPPSKSKVWTNKTHTWFGKRRTLSLSHHKNDIEWINFKNPNVKPVSIEDAIKSIQEARKKAKKG